MSKTVLFTPVGGTDPISWNNWRDGAILQICRKYKPDMVYMYMSAEILENHYKDDRYRYCINKLAENMGCKIDIKIIAKPELREVQKFNFFYVEFSEILDQISEGLSTGDELLLNVSSGTPAMKSSLMVLSSLTRMKCKVIQVSTPIKGMNEHNHTVGSIKELWECDEDNDPDQYEDRTEEVDCPWIVADQKKRLIRNHVLAYDYEAAIRVHEQMPLCADGTYVKLLRAAAERKQLNDQKMLLALREAGEEKNSIFRPIKNDEMRMLFEYILTLDIRQKRGEYGDFVRALTPPITELFIKILEKEGSINIKEYYYINDEKKKRWKLDKIQGTQIEQVMSRNLKWDDKQKGYVSRPGRTISVDKEYIQSTQLLNLIKEYVGDEKTVKLCETLRHVEDEVRNRVAHEMVGISDDFIRAKVSLDSKEIVQIIQKLLCTIDGGLKRHLDSYDNMNAFILDRMEKEIATS